MALFLLASPADPLAPFLPLSSSSSPKPHPPGHRDTSWWSSTVHHRPTPGRPRMGPGSPDLAPGGPDRQKAALPARGGHFLRDPHVDLLIWCVPAGRLGGLLLGQINCLIILCSSNVTIQQEIQGKQDTCMGYLMCTKLMCTDKFFFQYPHRRQQKSSIYAFWELLCLLNILARLTDILTEFSSISGQSVGRLVKGWP
ncbi:uncharacterized protein LOC119331500 isoform X1 [Triticum dicoccoides]|uniref:uncharacterized protein LOC119331500 isoform X1 n=1 Tax=Triticum dicoccoides TaxID=85692 RepID=UPI0018919EDC|nr:uncharacterized protein LOC119331500 isoform X1 [Triticum dicoccoides]